MSSLPPQVDVLIVGAGPTGLAAALALHKEGCRSMLVVDALLAGENTSRAIAVHAATLEALEEIGCADTMVKEGRIARDGKLWDGYRFYPMEDYGILAPHTKYPFVLFTPQSVTERILGERVQQEGIDVQRPYKVAEVRVNAADFNLSDVVFEDGQIVKARYIIGADGSKSIVRHCAGIGYADPDGDAGSRGIKQAVLADIAFTEDSAFGSGDAMFILSSGNFLILIALPTTSTGGKQAWRVALGVPDELGTPPHAPPKEYLQQLLDAYGPASIPASAMPGRKPIVIEEVLWSTRFRTHCAIADTPFARLGKGTGAPVVLVGDAAHLHPPTGGQGMNLGLRDAVFLAPVLMEHLRQSVSATTAADRGDLDKPLQKWADWRHGQALKVIALARGILTFATWKNEVQWYFGIIPVNLVWIRSWLLWVQEATGARRRNPFKLSGLANR